MTPEEKEALPAEEQAPAEKPLSLEETERRLKRKEEVEAVSQLLKEAFGSATVEEARPEPEEEAPEEEAEEVLATYDGRHHDYAVETGAEDLLPPRKEKRRSREVYKWIAVELTRVGIPLAMLPVYTLIVLILILFGMSPPFVLGSLATMILFTGLGLRPLDVFGIMCFLIVSMEMVDLYRQWGRLGILLGF